MAVSPGTRLGPYEVVSKLGEGGPACVNRSLRSQRRRGLAVAQVRIWL